MRHSTKFYYFTFFLVCLLSAAQLSYADGSKDLYAAGNGGRAKLRSSTVTSTSYPFANLNTHYVYAVAGETITLASSTMGTGNSRIKLTKPDGTLTSYSSGGLISNRNAEVAGPRLPGVSGGNYYTPITYTVQPGETGIFSVDFVPPVGETGNSQTGRESSSILCTANWTAPASNDIMIAAWDVSIYDSSNTLIPGRVYTTVLNLDINQDFAATKTYYGKMLVLTQDGYVYQVDNNGNNGISFEFFVNNSGFVDASGQPIYKSLNTTTLTNGQIKDPRTVDGTNSVTHKMFYRPPASDLPLTGTGAIAAGVVGTTWLKNPRLLPEVDNIKVFGVEGTEGQISNKGGTIKFDANLAGRFLMNITPVAPANFPARSLTGFATAGNNTVNWDGKDGAGNPLPAGGSPALLTIKLQGAEVHFPYFDMEINPNGIKLELLKADMVTVESDIVYWDDTDINPKTGASVLPISNPINASQTAIPAGTSSSTNGHKWGSNSSPTSGTFGDVKSMDTWTFLQGAEKTLQTTIVTKKSDLKINSILQSGTEVSPNGNITYTVEVQNSDGTATFSDVLGAPFAFNVPPGMEIISVTPISSCGGITNNPVISADKRHFTAQLDMVNGCIITYQILTKATSIAPGAILVEATIMRPNDVIDPDATNPDPAIPPTDPHVECKNGTVAESCNNIKYNSIVTALPAAPSMRLTKTGTYADSNGDGKVNVGDKINYTFKVENTGEVSLTNITISDPKVTVNGGPISLAPAAVDNTTFTATYTLTQADIDKGGVYNLATASGKDPSNNTVVDESESGNPAGGSPGVPPVDPACPGCTITPLPSSPAMRLTKTGTYADSKGDGKVNVGDKINYTFKVENTGNVSLTGITISDPKVTVTGGPVNLAPNAVDNTSFAAVYTLTQADVDKGGVYNLATASGKDPSNNTVVDESESGNPAGGSPGVPPVDPACPTCTITPLPSSPAMRLTKTGTYADSNGDGKVNVGDKINYTFKVENTGNVSLTGITISDPKVTVTGGPVNLAPNAVDNTSFTAVYTLTQADVDKGGVYNLATASGKDPSNNTVVDVSESGNPAGGTPGVPPVDPACPTCTITPLPSSPAMRLTKTGTYADSNGDGKVNVGDKINYTFKVENTGNVSLTNISISDPKVTVIGGPVNLAPNAVDNTSFAAVYTLTQADIDKGGVYNLATASGKDPSNNTVVDESESGNPAGGSPGVPPVDPACPGCTITPLPSSPAMRLTKTGTYADSNGDGKVNVGDKINYTFKVENTGNVSLTNISISDPKVTVTGGPVNLAPNAVDNTSFAAVYTLTQADIDKGGVYNLATASGKDPSNNTVVDVSESGNPAGGSPGVPPVDPACPTCTITPLPSSPAMRLTKTGTYADSNGDGKVNVGDKINYTFKVENTGNVSLTGITISDPKVTVTGGPVNLAPNAVDNTSFTAVYTLTQADVDKGGVYNLATASGKDPSNNTVVDVSESGNPAGGSPGVPPVDPACPTCTITPLPSSPAMRLTKTGTYADSNGDGKVNVGDKINYTFKVENTGNVSLTNISISDPKVTVIGGPVNLAPNAVDNTSFTAVYTLTQADIDKGGVYNLATASGKDPSNNTVVDESESGNAAGGSPGVPPVDPACPTCTITPLPSSPAMRLTKTGTYADSNGDGKVNVGDKINYTFKVENTGNVSLTGITISDPKVTVNGGPISLAPAAVDNTTFTTTYTLTQADIDKGGVYNLATASGKDPSNNTVVDVSESGNPAGGSPGVPPVDPACPGCTITPLPSSPSMRLTKTGTYADSNGDGKVNVGDKINYTFKVENTGNVSLTGITISDPKVTVTGGPVNLAPNAVDNTSFTAVYTLTQADVDKGGVYNLATASGKDPSNNTVVDESESGNPAGGSPGVPPVDPACPTCTITPLPSSPAMRLTKTGTYADSNGDGKVNVGDKINYTFKVENTGNVSLTNISISDPKVTVTGGPVNLAPNAVDNTSFTAVYTLTQADIDKGGVYNLATASGKDPSNNTVVDESESGNPAGGTPGVPPVDPACPTCTITPLPSSPAMRLTKTGTYADSNGDGKVNVGDKINYTFKVENTGNVSLTNISISDPKVTVSGGPISLAPNAVDNTSFTAVYTLTQADVDKGGVYNLATASGKDPSNNTVVDESESGNPAGGSPGVPPVDPACPGCTITPLPSSPAITLTKNTVKGTYNKVGDVINYILKVKNTGNVTLANVNITDANADAGSILPGTIATLNVGAEVTVSAKHTLTQIDLNKGFVYNIANAEAKDPKGGDVNAVSKDNDPAYPNAPVDPTCPTCTITEIEQKASIALIKKVTNVGTGENGAFVLGDQIEYTFTITNTGNVTLSNLVLNDPLLSASVINIPGTLNPGGSLTHIEKYTITAVDVAKGNVTNQALISGADPKNKIVTDQSGTANTDDVPTVTVIAKPPVASDNTAETKQNVEIKIPVLNNDVPGSSPVVPGSINIVTPPKHGTVLVNADGTVTYKPNVGFTGADDFTYTVKDKNGQVSNPAKATINIIPTEPVALDDAAETQWNTEIKIPVYGNDKADVSPLDKTGLEITTQPKHGVLKMNPDGSVTYLPNSGYTGKDTFSYRIKDENGNWSNVAIVSIDIKGFFIPNVITPNGDGKNDNFVIVGLENFSNVELTIFNRWGNEVYRNKNYQNTWTGDGLNGGTYYYLIRMSNNGKQEVYKGWVLIKR